MGKVFSVLSIIFATIPVVIPVFIFLELMSWRTTYLNFLISLEMVVVFIFSPMAIIFGVIGKKKEDLRGLAIAGIILGSIALVVVLMFLVAFILAATVFAPVPVTPP